MSTKITVETNVHAPIEKVWKFFNEPEHIVKWGHPSDDWHTVRADNDLKVGGKFNYRMEARDGSAGFDFGATYDEIVPHEFISYTMGDGRKVDITFMVEGDVVQIIETFDSENENTLEKQRDGWQAILNNFKKYTESTN